MTSDHSAILFSLQMDRMLTEKARSEKLREAKERTWFYEFELPDGTRTRMDLPEE
ncbi:MAG: hypothetical protein ACJ746_12170 [Bryobacteraceae bacterium]